MNTNSGLVRLEHGELTTTSLVIAEGVRGQHKNVLELIRANLADLEEFGQVAFQTRPGYNNAPVQIAHLNEQQTTLLLTYMRNNEIVRDFKKRLVKAFYEMRDSSYTVGAKSELDIIRDQHKAISLLLEANEDATARALQAESTVEFIEGSAGLSVAEFHKQYFSDVPAMRFNQFLYEKKLLINQLHARGRDDKGRWKNGKQHRHPTFRGKAFFFLDPTVDRETGERYYQTKVRPGTPEVELVRFLSERGLAANANAPRILAAVTA